MMTDYKQVIVIRKDLDLSRGKAAAQAAHAALGAYQKADKKKRQAWKRSGSKKVVLCVNTEQELINTKADAERSGLTSYMVTDAGQTEIPHGTRTALAIGPAAASKIDKITGSLPLYE